MCLVRFVVNIWW